jgi:hypothetical protein
MNICEFIQEKVAVGEIDDNVSAHLRICHECKAFADDLDRFLSCDLPDAGEPPRHIDDAIRAAAAEAAQANRFLSCELPDVGEPPKHIDDAIRAEAARVASANIRRKHMVNVFRILIPTAAALAVCFLFYFEPMTKPQALALPTQTTVAGDWTGAVMDGELTQLSIQLESSMSDLSLSDTDLLIAQLEADFAAYAEN